jgi:twitching motility two-component system response regulator PilH
MSQEVQVLIVEDSPTARHQMVEIVSDAGYSYLVAEDGATAIELIREHHPEVVVLDIVLPKKNGYQVCRTIKNDPELAIKVLMVTAKDQENDRIWGHRQGADGYLSKPIHKQELLDALSGMITTVY